MTKIEIYAMLSDATESLNGVKRQLEAIKEALDERIDWEALENPRESLS